MWFLHKWLNPHCEHCREQEREAKHCDHCDMWKQEVARLQIENDRLLERILERPVVESPKEVDLNEIKPLIPKSLPWNERRRLLENESREKARLLKQNGASDVDKLEEEILGSKNA